MHLFTLVHIYFVDTSIKIRNERQLKWGEVRKFQADSILRQIRYRIPVPRLMQKTLVIIAKCHSRLALVQVGSLLLYLHPKGPLPDV